MYKFSVVKDIDVLNQRHFTGLELLAVEPFMEQLSGYCDLDINVYDSDGYSVWADFLELNYSKYDDSNYVCDLRATEPCSLNNKFYVGALFCIENDYNHVYMDCYNEPNEDGSSVTIKIKLD